MQDRWRVMLTALVSGVQGRLDVNDANLQFQLGTLLFEETRYREALDAFTDPAVYLPAFVTAPQVRSDVVQYTRLAGCSLGESTSAVTAKHWPEAEKVIAQVLRFAP